MNQLPRKMVSADAKKIDPLKRVILILGVLSFVNFDYLTMIGLGPVMSALQIATIAASLVYLIVYNRRIEAYFVTWVMLCIWVVVTTAVNGADLVAAVRFGTKILLPALFFLAFEDDFYTILRIIYVVLGVLTLANLITIIAFPNGMYVTGVTNMAYENWLLGFKNKHIVFYLPLMLATFCLIEKEGLSWDKVVALASIVLASILAGSSTAIVCMVILVVLSFVPFFRARYHVFNPRTYLIVGILLFVFIVLVRAQGSVLGSIVESFGKDMTFSNRTLEWDIALASIAESPIIGNGYLSIDARHMLYVSQSVMSAHDQLLEYAFVGGLFLVAVYLLANILLVKHLQAYAAKHVVQFAAAIYFGMLIVMLTEVYEDILFYSLYFMLWNVPILLEGQFSGERRRCCVRR